MILRAHHWGYTLQAPPLALPAARRAAKGLATHAPSHCGFCKAENPVVPATRTAQQAVLVAGSPRFLGSCGEHPPAVVPFTAPEVGTSEKNALPDAKLPSFDALAHAIAHRRSAAASGLAQTPVARSCMHHVYSVRRTDATPDSTQLLSLVTCMAGFFFCARSWSLKDYLRDLFFVSFFVS